MVIRKFEQRSGWQVSAEKHNRDRNRVCLRADVDQHLADDVDIEIGGRVEIIEGAVFTESIASCIEDCAHRLQPYHSPGLVMTVSMY
jgi:hypothetical protein